MLRHIHTFTFIFYTFEIILVAMNHSRCSETMCCVEQYLCEEHRKFLLEVKLRSTYNIT